MHDKSSFKKISMKYRSKVNADIAKMEKDQVEFEKQNNYLMSEWRQYIGLSSIIRT